MASNRYILGAGNTISLQTVIEVGIRKVRKSKIGF